MPTKQLKTRSPTLPTQEQLLEIPDMTGGVNLRSSPTQVEATHARTLVNWQLSEPGALTVFPGHQQFSTTSLGNSRIQGGARVYLSSHTFLLAGWNGAVYQPTDTGAWGSPVYSTINSTGQVFFPHDRDIVATFDGANAAVKSSNGSSWTAFGIAASTNASTLTQESSGALLNANEYEISYTYRDTDQAHESNGSTALSTITMGSSGSIRAEARGSTDPQVDVVRFYARNVTAGETVRRLISTVANDTTGSTLSVQITDSNWSAAVAEPTDHHVPPTLAFGVIWKNRWWAKHATIGNRLHFTQIFQPQSWPATFYLDIPFIGGDKIQALIPMGDTLLVLGNGGIFLIIGQTSLDLEVRPALNVQDGALGPRAVAVIENGVIHAGASGVYVFDGASDNLLSHDIEPAWRDVVENAAVSDLIRIAVVYHALRHEVRIAVPRRFPAATFGEWVLDLNRTREQESPAWTSTDRPIGGYVLYGGAEETAGDQGRLFSWTDTTGVLFEEATGTTANSSNMLAEYEGPGLGLGWNRARALEVRGEYEPHGGALTHETLVDGVSQGQIGIEIGAGLSVYGTGTYGTAPYAGTGRRMFHKMLPVGAEGRTLTERFTYSGQEAFRLFTYAFAIRPEPRPRGFSE